MKKTNFIVGKKLFDKNFTNNVIKMSATEGARRATGVADTAAISGKKILNLPDPEVREKKRRRRFTAKYKLQILIETDNCTESCQVGKILRREGLYYSNLTLWRKQRERGILHGITPKKRGRRKKQKNPLVNEVTKLQKENSRLQTKLKRAELIIEAQKKISEIMGISLKEN